MSKAVSLNEHIYNLLIIRGINQFTVTEARDALMEQSEYFSDEIEARKVVYRQILRLLNKGLLAKTNSEASQTVKYFKTEQFSQTDFTLKHKKKSVNDAQVITSKQTVHDVTDFFWSILEKEKLTHEADLQIVLGELEEFKRLLSRFPEKREHFESFYFEAKERSTTLLGKVNALTKVLNTTC